MCKTNFKRGGNRFKDSSRKPTDGKKAKLESCQQTGRLSDHVKSLLELCIKNAHQKISKQIATKNIACPSKNWDYIVLIFLLNYLNYIKTKNDKN